MGNLVESLKKQNYNKELYDIYVIADNCTDGTAKVAKEAGAIVYERFNNTQKTKGFALDWTVFSPPSGLTTSNLTINPVPFNNGDNPKLYLAK